MNKGDLINIVAKEAKLTKGQADVAITSLINAITNSLSTNKNVKLVGFGTFSVVTRAARKGLNPRTKKEVRIESKKVAKFKPGTDLAGKVNK